MKKLKSRLKREADKLWSEIIRSRGKCEYCGSTSGLQASHVVSRRILSLRRDLQNGLCLCLKHHIYWQHKEPLEFADWFRGQYPDRYKYLMEKKEKITAVNIEEELEKLKELLK